MAVSTSEALVVRYPWHPVVRPSALVSVSGLAFSLPVSEVRTVLRLERKTTFTTMAGVVSSTSVPK